MKLETTKDGSHTLISSRGKSYHSLHGAIQETAHVFINAGLNAVEKRPIRILEIGFGTGLNAFMTLLSNEKVDYTTVEAYPVPENIASQLNYPSLLNAENQRAAFMHMHLCVASETIALSPNMRFTKLIQRFETLDLENNSFDLIYFDAFAPTDQPELWDDLLLGKMYRVLRKGGFLCTYCAKGSVKRCLKAQGFTIQALPGPPFKREMTRAVK